MIWIILKCFYLLLPGAFANMAPGIFKWFNILKDPVDFGHKFKGKRILGDNKTWHGVVFGIISAVFVVYVQSLLYVIPFFEKISLLDYSDLSFVTIGTVFAIGAVGGDLVESIFKRRLNIKPGGTLLFLDQADWVIGSFCMLFLIYVPSLEVVVISLVMFIVLHIVMRHISYYLGTVDSKW